MTSTLMATQKNALRQVVSASVADPLARRHVSGAALQARSATRIREALASHREEAFKLRNTNLMAMPKFKMNQMVCFMGGVGTIKNYQPDADTWSYAVEMEMGQEPDFGRVGFETTILLDEADILGVMN